MPLHLAFLFALFDSLVNTNSTNTNFTKFLPTQWNVKGLAAQVHSSRLNLSIDIHAGKALVEDNGYSRQLLLRCSQTAGKRWEKTNSYLSSVLFKKYNTF